MSLDEIAGDMKRIAQWVNQVEQRLTGGLTLSLEWNPVDESWTLSLSREATAPSKEEVKIAKRSFEVGSNAEVWYSVNLRWLNSDKPEPIHEQMSFNEEPEPDQSIDPYDRR